MYVVMHHYLSILREQNIVADVEQKSHVEKGSESMENNVALVVGIWRLLCVFKRLLLNGEKVVTRDTQGRSDRLGPQVEVGCIFGGKGEFHAGSFLTVVDRSGSGVLGSDFGLFFFD
jgi:hypothetical protein